MKPKMKIKLKELRKLIKEAIIEYGTQPAPAPSRPKPGIAEPPTRIKPTPKRRRPLTPPDPSINPNPKNENEQNLVKKIVKRYKNEK